MATPEIIKALFANIQSGYRSKTALLIADLLEHYGHDDPVGDYFQRFIDYLYPEIFHLSAK